MRLASMIAAVGLAAGGAGMSGADTLSVSTKARTDIFKKQLDVIDRRASVQYSNSVRLLPDYDELGAIRLPRQSGPRDPGPYLDMARAAARKHAIPEELFFRLVRQESGWNPNAVSHKGARGLAQLMPATARYLGVDPDDPRQNLEGGARYLREQYRRFGSWRLALAAYNAGPGAVERYDGIPPYKETQGYVRAILGR